MTQPAPPAEDTAQEPHPGVLTRLEKLKEALQSENTQATKKTLTNWSHTETKMTLHKHGLSVVKTALGRKHQASTRQSSHLVMVRFHWQL